MKRPPLVLRMVIAGSWPILAAALLTAVGCTGGSTVDEGTGGSPQGGRGGGPGSGGSGTGGSVNGTGGSLNGTGGSGLGGVPGTGGSTARPDAGSADAAPDNRPG